MIKNVDYAENNQINYTEFLSATINPEILQDDKTLEGIFNLFDVDNTNEITVDNLVQTFSKFGREFTKDEVKQVMKAHDLNNEGTISFDEFKIMIQT